MTCFKEIHLQGEIHKKSGAGAGVEGVNVVDSTNCRIAQQLFTRMCRFVIFCSAILLESIPGNSLSIPSSKPRQLSFKAGALFAFHQAIIFKPCHFLPSAWLANKNKKQANFYCDFKFWMEINFFAFPTRIEGADDWNKNWWKSFRSHTSRRKGELELCRLSESVRPAPQTTLQGFIS